MLVDCCLKKEAVEESEAVVTTVLAEKTEESTTLEAVIFVDIKGAVKKPGIYQMKVGDRERTRSMPLED